MEQVATCILERKVCHGAGCYIQSVSLPRRNLTDGPCNDIGGCISAIWIFDWPSDIHNCAVTVVLSL